MKKRFLILITLFVLLSSSAFAVTITGSGKVNAPAKSRVGVGAELGYPFVNAVVTYTNADPSSDIFGFRFYSSLGFGYYTSSFNLGVSADWIFYQCVFTNTGSKEAENSVLDLSLGAGANMGFGSSGYIGPVGAFAVNYTFARDWTVFVRTHLGYTFGIYGNATSHFFGSGVAGFTYGFDV